MEKTLRALSWSLFLAWWIAICCSLVDGKPHWWLLSLILPAWAAWQWARKLGRARVGMDDDEAYMRKERRQRQRWARNGD